MPTIPSTDAGYIVLIDAVKGSEIRGGVGIGGAWGRNNGALVWAWGIGGAWSIGSAWGVVWALVEA